MRAQRARRVERMTPAVTRAVALMTNALALMALVAGWVGFVSDQRGRPDFGQLFAMLLVTAYVAWNAWTAWRYVGAARSGD